MISSQFLWDILALNASLQPRDLEVKEANLLTDKPCNNR